MKRYLLFSLILVVFAVFSSCKDKEKLNYWGQTEHFDDYLWKKYVPDTLKRTLKIGFNDDAINDINAPLILSLYKRNSDGEYKKVNSKEVKMFVDGELSEKNTISIMPKDNEEPDEIKIEVSIVLSEEILGESDLDRDYHFAFKVDENPGLDRINDCNVAGNKKPLLDDSSKIRGIPMIIHVDEKVNPVKVGIDIGLVIFSLIVIAVLILWFSILKFVYYPKIKVSIDINGEYYMHKSKNKYHKIVLCDSNNRKKQSGLSKLFKGEILYSVNEMWSESPITILPSGKTVKLDISDDYTIQPYEFVLDKNVAYSIKNKSNQKIEIIIGD